MRKIALLALWLLAFLSPSAADHLYPEGSVYGGDAFAADYDLQVVSVQKDAMDRDVLLRMIVVPSFVPERAIGIRKASGHFEIFALETAEAIWGYSQRHAGKIKIQPDGNLRLSDAINSFRDSPDRIPVKQCSIVISQETVNRLAAVWERALLQVSYDGDPNMGLDGATYHFAMRNGYQFMAGQVWSPSPSNTTGQLVELAFAMSDYCTTKSPQKLNDLVLRASALRKAMP